LGFPKVNGTLCILPELRSISKQLSQPQRHCCGKYVQKKVEPGKTFLYERGMKTVSGINVSPECNNWRNGFRWK
jgi:hypothetical protein